MRKNESVVCCLTVLLVAATAFSTPSGNWPGWRGPEGTGVSSEKNLPVKLGATENVRWRVQLPGPCNSSPIAWGDRVFVTQALDGGNRRTVMCFDRADGKLLWQSGEDYSDKEPTQQQNNPYCSATPVTDGERVIASFGSAGLYCYDFAGKELWHRNLGKMSHMFGNASSPLLYGDLCILPFGPDEKARLIAINKRTGETVWEVEPPKVDPSEQQSSEGPGGAGGPGGFGPAMFLAPQMFSQADKNGDHKLTKEEFTALADAWFDKLDSNKTGNLSQEQFTERLGNVLPPPEGFGPPDGGPGDGPRPEGGPRFGPAGFVGPALFRIADADKNGSLTRAELKSTFEKWYEQWDSDKSGALTEEKLRDGLNVVLPQPDFGGPGGPSGPGDPGGPRGPQDRGSPSGTWSTPIIVKADGHDELVMAFPYRLAAYDPKTGKQFWLSKGIDATIYATPVWGENAVVAMSTGMGKGNVIAVKPGGSGDVTESRRLWHLEIEIAKSRIGSGVIHEGHFYAISYHGIAECVELKTGKTVWEQQLKGQGAKSSSWSSMLLADGKIYVPNQSGDVFVLRASPQFELLATNSVSELTNASLAASNGELLMRTEKNLWCFASSSRTKTP